MVGLLALVYLPLMVFKKKYSYLKNDGALVFSLLYICAVVFLDVFFTNTIDGKTNIWSVNRHVLASPFGIYFIFFLIDYNKGDRYLKLFAISLLSVLVFFLTETYKFPFATLTFSLFISGLLLFNSTKQQVAVKLLLCAGVFLCQIVIYERLLLHYWIG